MGKIKFMLLFFVLLFSLFLSGCNNKANSNEDSEISVKNMKQEFKEKWQEMSQPNVIVCSVIDKIKNLNSSNIILTTDGELYSLSLNKKFVDETNCKKIETDLRFDSYFKNYHSIFKIENEYYRVAFDDVENSYIIDKYNLVSEVVKYYLKNNTENILFIITDEKSSSSGTNNTEKYLTLKADGNIYEETFEVNIWEKTYRLISSKIKYKYSEFDGEINDIFKGDDISFNNIYIKTERAYYKSVISNSCDKYVDVECEYKFKKDDILTKYNKIIKYYDGNFLIDIDNNIYQLKSVK